MKVPIDTDVLIDLALGREPHHGSAGELLDAMGRRHDVVEFVEIAATTTESVRQAGRLKLRDFEDAMQVAAAMACRADVIATRNSRD